MTLLLGLVGGGWISGQHLEALERLGRTQLVGVVAGTPETGDAVTARWGGTRFDDVDAMLMTAKLDAVYVAVPPHRAVPICEQLVAAPDPVPDREAAVGRGRTARPAWRPPSSRPASSSPSATTCARSTSWPRSASDWPPHRRRWSSRAGWTRRRSPPGGARSTRAAARSSSRRPTCTTSPATLIGEATVVGAASTRARALASRTWMSPTAPRRSSASRTGRSARSPTRAGSTSAVIEVEFVSDGLITTLEKRSERGQRDWYARFDDGSSVRVDPRHGRPVRDPGGGLLRCRRGRRPEPGPVDLRRCAQDRPPDAGRGRRDRRAGG